VYGGDAIDVSSDAGPIVLGVVRTLVTGPAVMAVMMETKDKVDAFIQDDSRIMASELCTTGIK